MTCVALLWHMHQPFYQDLLTGEHVMPWVRLHALKDYWGMVALLREFPSVRVTFNLVPSLLVQLEAFAREEARDRHLEIGLKPADRLTEEERAFCVEHFFHAHRPRMIEPYARYRELLDRRGTNGGLSARAQASQLSVEDLRDLQVWHKLVWIDPEYHRDPRIDALLSKARGFTEADKLTLREVELELLRKVIPEYADAAARGQVELSTSPFYHPILPLLCATDVYLRTHPQARMPRQPFRHPEDAAEQLVRAVALHERLFGSRPEGLWPSEGSVSDAMVRLAGQTGFRWMATDEEILARTLGRPFSRTADGHVEQAQVLYRPYRVGQSGHTLACGFRDHTLSDLIGFRYSGWSADGAATDFVHRLVEGGRRYSAQGGGGEATIFVILDGENAWEHYDGQGRPFLRALYRGLASHPEIRTVTMAEACRGAAEALPAIFPGSWINGDFYIWIGHADDQRAWSQLVEARWTLETARDVPEPARARALEEMLIAEGSDWFWWYGDDHSSDHDVVFDDLFRRHVRNVYRALDRPIPEDLFVTNISTEPPPVAVERPTGFISPVIDGVITSYFEWIGAGGVDVSMTGGTMHQVSDHDNAMRVVEFGFDRENLFLRIDGARPMRELLDRGVELRLKFVKPMGLQVRLFRGEAGVRVELEQRTPAGSWTARRCAAIRAAVGPVAEIQLPFECLDVGPQAAVALFVVLVHNGTEIGHHPRQVPIEFEVPDERFAARHWSV